MPGVKCQGSRERYENPGDSAVKLELEKGGGVLADYDPPTRLICEMWAKMISWVGRHQPEEGRSHSL